MLIKFEVDNFKGFTHKYVLDLSHRWNYTFNSDVINENDDCITKAIIYGKNGSGKSSLGLALFDIVSHLTDHNSRISDYRNYINLETKSDLARFKYVFRFGNDIIEYSYSKSDFKVLENEELKINGKILFSFDYSQNEGKALFHGSEDLKLNADNSRISRLKYIMNTAILDKDDLNNQLLMKFYSFVNNMLLFYSLDSRGYIGFQEGAEDIGSGIIKAGKLEEFQKFLNENGIEYELFEKKIDDSSMIYCRFPNGEANFFNIASTGTRSLALFYYWYIKMGYMSLVYMDEFDAFYHFELAESIVKYIKQLKNTQVIMTTQNTDLLSNDLLRPDCYFEINNGKLQVLSDSTDKELRMAHNLQKMYKAGAFDEK